MNTNALKREVKLIFIVCQVQEYKTYQRRVSQEVSLLLLQEAKGDRIFVVSRFISSRLEIDTKVFKVYDTTSVFTRDQSDFRDAENAITSNGSNRSFTTETRL